MKMSDKKKQIINAPVEINRADRRYLITPDSLIDHNLIKKEPDV